MNTPAPGNPTTPGGGAPTAPGGGAHTAPGGGAPTAPCGGAPGGNGGYATTTSAVQGTPSVLSVVFPPSSQASNFKKGGKQSSRDYEC